MWKEREYRIEGQPLSKGLSEGMGVAVANILESTATITLVTTNDGC